MVMEKKKSNAGRKPSMDPKVRVVFFLEQSLVDHNGGMDDCKVHSYLYLKERGEKIKKSSLTNVH